ncbi:Short chain dehydrogenase atnD [Colletotrichum orbiculare MAFF 240422]|uniref:Short chain dehydrogenase atnD n=1 Tax=Colletotrichum orbiculare (strain 104-T / ATCC 96160 / CBS 514.97 / LARS 414 / MAFF 240422) TaxID=1213857 RepID=N4VAV7_COLOR|nr:Short chain dehydrogenase atnD [Colletotrichum orbiculare MAFF 240422]
MSPLSKFLHSQLFFEVPYPAKSFSGQTVIVTGSNTGLGLEAARHFARLGAEKVILAVRNLAKGEAAANSIEETTGRKDATEVWELDLASYASVERFAARVNGLARLDVLVGNAGVLTYDFVRAEDNELMMTVNVVSTLLLAILLLPKLRETALRWQKETVLTFTGSLGHTQAEFPERESRRILEDLADEKKARMHDRYNVSKLIEVLLVRELADRVTSSKMPGNVVVSILNPGIADTEMARNVGWFHGKVLKVVFGIVGRTPEAASRTIVLAAGGGQETHGKYLDDGKVGEPSAFVLSSDGNRVQKQLWDELLEKLEDVHSDISALVSG